MLTKHRFNLDLKANPKVLDKWAEGSTLEKVLEAQAEARALMKRIRSGETRFYLRRFVRICDDAILDKVSVPTPTSAVRVKRR